MEVTVSRSKVGGSVRAPPSKSYTHRAILAAGYGQGTTAIRSPLLSADTRATARAVEAFGGRIEGDEAARGGVDDGDSDIEGGGITDGSDDEPSALSVTGFGGVPAVPENVLDCANSGTTMRLVCATAALCPGSVVLTGDDSLRSRPQGPLLDAIRDLGGRAESTRSNGQAPLVVGGRNTAPNSEGRSGPSRPEPISGGGTSIPGDVSSQFVSALLMAGAVADEGIEIGLETELKSAPYVEITREVLAAFDVDTERTERGFTVPGNQTYRPSGGEYTVPGDFSSASYLLAAGVLVGEDGLRVEGIYPSAQGDSAIVEFLDRMGATIAWDREAGIIEVEESDLSSITVDVGDTPDLLPTIATLGAAADGETRIVNCEHVRYKETDRVAAMAAELERLGASVTEEHDTLTIRGGDSTLRGTRVSGYADHRIVMALSVCGLIAEGETTIADAEHVDVSFPGFFDVVSGVGATVES